MPSLNAAKCVLESNAAVDDESRYYKGGTIYWEVNRAEVEDPVEILRA